MAYDERDEGRERRRRDRHEDNGPPTAWRGDDRFGGGFGNQTARPQRLGDRGARPSDDPYYGTERYGGGGMPQGYGGDYGPRPYWGDSGAGGIGYDPQSGPRFDRIDIGSTGTQGVHPVSSVFNPAYGASGGYISSARDYAIVRHDPHYAEWRRRRIAELDRDYEDYRREHQDRFDREFGAWRETRGRQRSALDRVTEHMEVIGSDGAHVGTVDKVRGEHIVLTKSDPAAGGVHHAIPCGWIDEVDDKVRLNLAAEDAFERWRVEGRSRALFEPERTGHRRPHILGRAFSGTPVEDED